MMSDRGRVLHAWAIIMQAIENGISLELDISGDNLMLKGPSKPPDDLLERLKEYKDEIIEILRPTVHPRETRRDREITRALNDLLAIADRGVRIMPIPMPLDLSRLALQNVYGVCEFLKLSWTVPRPPGYSDCLWLSAVAEADSTGQPPGMPQ